MDTEGTRRLRNWRILFTGSIIWMIALIVFLVEPDTSPLFHPSYGYNITSAIVGFVSIPIIVAIARQYGRVRIEVREEARQERSKPYGRVKRPAIYGSLRCRMIALSP